MLTGDPQKVVSTLTYNVLGNIYDGLIDRDRTLRLQPGLAVSWTMVAPTVWEFKLRRGVKFHDGEPFNAAAVKFTIGRALDPKTRWPGAGLLRGIKSVDVVDDLTVRMTTAQPWPLLPSYLAYYGMMLPPQYVAQNGEDALAKHPVGTGPYRFVSWAKDDHVELEANPDVLGGPAEDHARLYPDDSRSGVAAGGAAVRVGGRDQRRAAGRLRGDPANAAAAARGGVEHRDLLHPVQPGEPEGADRGRARAAGAEHGRGPHRDRAGHHARRRRPGDVRSAAPSAWGAIRRCWAFRTIRRAPSSC